ncbi:MAG: ABC transporter ATP-binding protein [Thermodesulfobacteriota bacterium]
MGKRYRLGQREPIYYRTLRDSIARHLGQGLKKAVRLSPLVKAHGDSDADKSMAREWIWALKDVSFEVKKGDVVGIIGRNGAGKSTLLKILSRITEPTQGRVEMCGRVASLLEIGTGFHPELTGRENVYLNGAILGMRKVEIDRKFDEIVSFAELQRFMDTPVKRYSSGMYVRLAFAVAAHLQPEILLVDEVLAVGDTAFQRKCLGKMGDVAQEGRTVLFVSHNMAAISSLCSRALLLQGGEIRVDGDTDQVVEEYMRGIKTALSTPLSDRLDRKGEGAVRITSACLLNDRDQEVSTVASGQKIKLSIGYKAAEWFDRPSLENVKVGLGVYSQLGTFLLYCSNEMVGREISHIPLSGEVVCVIPELPLTAGTYTVNISFTLNGVLSDWVTEALSLVVTEGDFFGTGRLPPITHGGFLTHHEWEVRPL